MYNSQKFVTGYLAQLVERRPYKANVGGSIPSAPTILWLGAVVQLVRMLACHAGGRGFESRPLRHLYFSLIIHLFLHLLTDCAIMPFLF